MTRLTWIGARSASTLPICVDLEAPRSELYSIVDGRCHVHPSRVAEFRQAVYNEAMLEWSVVGLTKSGAA
jgi:hypothetical protein